MKKKITIYVDEEMYKEFQIQSIIIGKSVSERIDEFIKEQIETNKKDDRNYEKKENMDR